MSLDAGAFNWDVGVNTIEAGERGFQRMVNARIKEYTKEKKYNVFFLTIFSNAN